MNETGDRFPSVWPVRHYVEEAMQARGWDRQALADAADYGVKFFDQVFDVEPLTDWTIRTLAYVFGTSEDLWRNLDRFFWQALRTGSYHLEKNLDEDC